MLRVLIAVVALLSAFSLAGAEMYQWVDDRGVVTLKDTPPPRSKKPKKVKTYSDSDFAPARSRPPASTTPKKSSVASPTTPKQPHFAGTVEIYVTDWCGYCKKALAYMDSKGISYVAYNIEEDDAAKQRFEQLGGRGVPLIVVGSNKMSGFSEEELEEYLR